VSNASRPRGNSHPRGNRHRSVIPPLRRVVALLLASVPLVVLAANSAEPQTTSHPRIRLAATLTADPEVEVQLPILIDPAPAIPRNSFVRVRGLPPMAALSDGHSIAPGSWAVPLHALPRLKLILPATAAGRAEVIVTLVTIDGSVLDEAKTTLVVHLAPASPGGAGRQSGLPQAARPDKTQGPSQLPAKGAEGNSRSLAILPPDHERALKLFKEGDKQMVQGNIAAARLVYELAAEAGHAQAAMALAATYDAAELARLNVRGIEPNTQEARRWYERARELGASDADQRLQRLGAK
jgi:hypothetical protein